jgi:hypothetical protein
METTKIQEKIKKESGTAFVITVVAGYFSVAIAALFLFLVVATGVNPGVNHPSPETALEDILMSSSPWIFNGVFVGIVSFFASKLFNEIRKSYTPFSEKNIKSLKSIATSTSMMGLVLLLFDFASNFAMDFDIRLRAFVVVYVLMGIIFGLFARIFDYGRLLQQESDETL